MMMLRPGTWRRRRPCKEWAWSSRAKYRRRKAFADRGYAGVDEQDQASSSHRFQIGLY
jgi:hypothetical protein